MLTEGGAAPAGAVKGRGADSVHYRGGVRKVLAMTIRSLGTASRFGAVMAGALALAGSGCVFNGRVVEEVRSAPVSATAMVSGLDISTRNGSVAIGRAEGEEILITATLRARTHERLADMKVVAEQNEAGVLVIRPEPPDGRWFGNEGCSIEVSAPAAATASGVTVKTGNGRITVTGVRGPADLRTSNGRIVVSEAEGEVRADTSNGRIEITDADGPVTADTSNGPVIVRLSPSARGPVMIDTSNGSVTLEVGNDFGGTVSARTSNGSIDLPERLRADRRGRRSAEIAMGSGPRSVISTSNGSIRVRMLELD